MKIAIISDLHCHAIKNARKDKRESFLIVGDPQVPAGRHPVRALLELARSKKMTVDALICPGDLANKVSKEGMEASWNHLRELQRAFKAKSLLCTVGNHDVDSRRKHDPNPFKFIQSFRPDFPLKQKAQKNNFWTNGFYKRVVSKNLEVLTLNTVIDHTDEKTAQRGTFDANDASPSHTPFKYKIKFKFT